MPVARSPFLDIAAALYLKVANHDPNNPNWDGRDQAIVRAAEDTGVVITAEEHQIGALACRLSSLLTESPRLYEFPVISGAIGVKDRFGDSGAHRGS
ncbi:MAG TPA: hypothetical protein VMQ17_15635 [Candidatus Sulfotelmatobacter sp.]|nr:hypothetical protein [Candidatus Sulfotelmatobacter sp.]